MDFAFIFIFLCSALVCDLGKSKQQGRGRDWEITEMCGGRQRDENLHKREFALDGDKELHQHL